MFMASSTAEEFNNYSGGAKVGACPVEYEIPSIFAKCFDGEESVNQLKQCRGAKLSERGDYQFIGLGGGRGSGKTFAAVSKKAVEDSYRKDYKGASILFIRELSGNISDTVDTVADILEQADLEGDFTIGARTITNRKTGCIMHFRSARSSTGRNQLGSVAKLKGIHNVRAVILEEAQELSEHTLNILIPTINRLGTIKIKGKETRKRRPPVFIAMFNPNLAQDPVILKFKEQSSFVHVHVNLTDIEEEFQDPQLIDQMQAESKSYYFDHVWLGKPFYLYSGLPFAQAKLVRTNETWRTVAFLDPSFMGGDFSAIAFVATDGNRIKAWGYASKQSWKAEINRYKDLLEEHNCVSFYYESNALGDAPEEEFAKVGVSALPYYSMGDKHNRIYRGAYQIDGKLDLVENKSNRDFIDYVVNYSHEAANDDPPDALISNLMAHGIINDKVVK